MSAPPSSDAILRRLEWTVIRRLDGLLQGDYRTLFRGAGLDLADLREYQHHDDVRHIDWNVTARLQTPYVRQFTEDRELNAWFLLDLSGSIDFGSQERTKRTVSAEFVTVLARILTRHGNRVGALFYGNQVDAVLPARSSRIHVLNLLQRMRNFVPPKAKIETQLGDLLHAAQQMIPRRSMVFVVSDFISTPGWTDALARLAQRHEVLAVRLYDAAEMELPDLGLVTIQDAEILGSASASCGPVSGAKLRCVRPSLMPESTRSSSRPMTTSSMRCCVFRRCGGNAAGSARAGACRRI